MKYNFRSDNESPAAPAIIAAVLEANKGTAMSYAEDRWSAKLDTVFSDLFGTRTTVLPLSTGTVANSIALASVSPPWGSVYCHRDAHIYCDESGAPEFFGNGLRLVPVEGVDGRITAADMDRLILANEGHGIHSYVPSAVSLTQSTECGTVYPASEIRSICEAAAHHGMSVHLDGARFANAVASLGCDPGDISCHAGVDLLSFGASKNGCMGAEALLIFDRPELAEKAERLRKRSGHLLSKMRFVSAQLLAYIENDCWLELARHANQQATRFATAVSQHTEARLEFPVDANEVFVNWSAQGFRQLEDAGMQFFMEPGRNDLARFVFSHCSQEEETVALCRALTG